MQDYKQKISQLKWLKSMGVNHFFLDDLNFKENIFQSITNIASLQEKEQPDSHPMKDKDATIETHAHSTYPQTTNMKAATKESRKHTQVKDSPPDNSIMQQARKLADQAKTLDELKILVENFDGCELKNLATNTVFADGINSAKVVLIGEAPGANEDQQGIPFCGESGKLLDKMISTIGLSRKTNTYITNTVFWRPPANRRPTTEEIDICRPFVEKHIALLDPHLIILVGSIAATSLLGKHDGISNIRKNSYSYSNRYISNPIAMKALFHPAYLLRQPSQKKSTWYDLIRIQQFLKEKSVNT